MMRYPLTGSGKNNFYNRQEEIMDERVAFLRAKIDSTEVVRKTETFVYTKFSQYAEGLITRVELESLISAQLKMAEQLISRILNANKF